MEVLPSNSSNSKIPPFAIFWIGLVLFCLCGSFGLLGLTGWGVYSIYQQAEERRQIPLATARAADEWPVFFSDDFSQPSDAWYVGDYVEAGYHDVRSISNGVYKWTLEDALNYTFWQPAGVGALRDFSVSVEVRHIAGTSYDGYGLIFCNAGGSYYVFSIHDAGYFSVLMWSADNKWSQLVPMTRVSAIQAGEYNLLRVLAEAGNFRLFINGEFVGEFQDNTLSRGDVGVMLNPQAEIDPSNPRPQGIRFGTAGSQVTVLYDNFEVRVPEGSQPDPDQPIQLPVIEPEAGKLVFVSDRDGNRNIYTIFSNGSGLKQLTDDPAADYSPRWSPDGKQIAFVSRRDGNAEIYVMDADGENLIRLTNHPAEDISPDWSPDGKQLIFASKRANNYNLYLMPVAGEQVGLVQLTDTKTDEINPTISPDGKLVLFQGKDRTAYRLYIIDIDGKNKKAVASNSADQTYSDGAWSPDASQIAYVYGGGSSGEIVIGEIPQEFSFYYPTHQITGNMGTNRYPNWSPSGEQVVFVSTMDGQADIYILLANANGLFRVTHNEAVEESPDWMLP